MYHKIQGIESFPWRRTHAQYAACATAEFLSAEIGTSMNQLLLPIVAVSASRSHFHGMLPVFDDYRSIVESLPKFLDQTGITIKSMGGTAECQCRENSRTLIQTGLTAWQLYACIASCSPANNDMLPSAAQGPPSFPYCSLFPVSAYPACVQRNRFYVVCGML